MTHYPMTDAPVVIRTALGGRITDQACEAYAKVLGAMRPGQRLTVHGAQNVEGHTLTRTDHGFFSEGRP